jgi:hypothetical protein
MKPIFDRTTSVVKVVCEGRFFELLGDAMGAAQKVVLEQTTSALGVADVLHNVIIVHPECYCVQGASL